MPLARLNDAMADVIATIEMAKKVKAAQPKLFDYFFSMRQKRKLNELVDIVNMTPLMHVSGQSKSRKTQTTLANTKSISVNKKQTRKSPTA